MLRETINFIANLILSLTSGFKQAIFEKKFYKENFIENLRRILWTCLPISILTVGASAIVYTIHVAPGFAERGLTNYLGGLVALSLIREGVPVMGSLAVIAQYCSSVTAQIGSMKVTDQIDAMKVAKVNPSSYLLVPIVLAGYVGFPVIIVICIFTGLFINYLATNFLVNISYNLYVTSILNTVQVKDLWLAMIKASVFGFFVTGISYNCGILTRGGAKEVGSSTRLSVILNFASVIILDYIITTLWL